MIKRISEIRLEPVPRGSGYSFENGVIRETVPTEYTRALEKRTQGDGLGEKNSSKSVALIPVHRTPQKPGGSP
jgi:hypothetical protein